MRRGKHGPGTTAKRVSRNTYETRGCWWAEGAWAHRQLCTQPLDLAGACVNILNFGAAGRPRYRGHREPHSYSGGAPACAGAAYAVTWSGEADGALSLGRTDGACHQHA